jgi:hypothetical protein
VTEFRSRPGGISLEVREAIQGSTQSIRTLAKLHGINPKTAAKWKNRTSRVDLSRKTQQHGSRSMTVEEENMAVSFRRHTMLPLDDCLYALQIAAPHLTRSSLHRCFQRHGINLIPKIDSGHGLESSLPRSQIGTCLLSLTELRTAEGRLYLYAASDRSSRFTFTQVVEDPDELSAAGFLDALVAAVPYKIRTALTSNRVQSTFVQRHTRTMVGHFETRLFGQKCDLHGIKHHICYLDDEWLEGCSVIPERSPKENDANHFEHENITDLEAYVVYFVDTLNFKRKLKCLRGLTPYGFICKLWETQPDLFLHEPYHLAVGPIRRSKDPVARSI